ncbi:hypothetical protein [Streptococcus pneumoniae]|uniref:hypothetical protein n=1 Tax=Streptococcus pneumoniae TaxID=1313 RepID=UPI00115684AB|nr:hypothetical protein [Streptococcus pneumoniae]
MKIKEQTRKLAAGCSKHCFEVVDDQITVLRLQIEPTKSAQNTVLRWQIEPTKSAQNTVLRCVDRTDEVSNHLYGKATLTWFEEIFEEY